MTRRREDLDPNRPRPDLSGQQVQRRAARLRLRQHLLLHPPGPDPMPGFSQAFGLVFLGRRPLKPGE